MRINSPKELAFFIFDRRKKLKFSQAKVGKLAGLKQQTISEFEIKPENTRIETLFRMLSVLDLDIALIPREKTNPILGWTEEW